MIILVWMKTRKRMDDVEEKIDDLRKDLDDLEEEHEDLKDAASTRKCNFGLC